MMRDTCKKITYKNNTVVYRDRGTGPTLFLLHGYLETGEIWDDFASKLETSFRVITMDLPGHGNSGIWGDLHSMEDLAGSVNSILDKEQIDRVFLVGHSMGGYVAMAFADLYPGRLLGYSLFHSTCFADTGEKKQNRDREISLVLCGKKRQIINVNIPKGFADINLDRLRERIDQVKRIALDNPDRGIIAILNGMKARPDRSHILKSPDIPLLLVGGMKDNYIPSEVFEKLITLAPHATVLKLEQSGHMGFMEEEEKVVEIIGTMIDKIV